MDLLEVGKAILEMDEVKDQLDALHLGIGTRTRNRVWLDLETAVFEAQNTKKGD